jgi:uncharacterized membrane protein YhiD involved in acid resistance
MNIVELLAHSLKDALKSETRAEYEERYLAESVDHSDFENRVRQLLEQRSKRVVRAKLQFAAAGR